MDLENKKHTINEFLIKYNLWDTLDIYDDQTITDINNVITSDTCDYITENAIVLDYIGCKYRYVLNDINEAERAFISAAATGLKSADFNLVALYESTGDFTKAEQYLLAKIDNDTNLEYLERLSTCYKIQHKYDLAVKYLLIAIEKEPANVTYIGNLASCYAKLKEYKLAEKYFLIVIDMDVTNMDYIDGLARCYYHKQEYEVAEKYFNMIVPSHLNV